MNPAQVRPGVWCHHKGGRYLVVAVALDSTNDWGAAHYVALASESHEARAACVASRPCYSVWHGYADEIDADIAATKYEATLAPVVVYLPLDDHDDVDAPPGRIRTRWRVRLASEWCALVPWPDGSLGPRFRPEESDG